VIELLEKILKHLEKHYMADFAKLTADIADLSAKVDTLIAKQAPPPPVDDQPAVDIAAAAVEAIAAKIPA
jgi:hypothetical protein